MIAALTLLAAACERGGLSISGSAAPDDRESIEPDACIPSKLRLGCAPIALIATVDEADDVVETRLVAEAGCAAAPDSAFSGCVRVRAEVARRSRMTAFCRR